MQCHCISCTFLHSKIKIIFIYIVITLIVLPIALGCVTKSALCRLQGNACQCTGWFVLVMEQADGCRHEINSQQKPHFGGKFTQYAFTLPPLQCTIWHETEPPDSRGQKQDQKRLCRRSHSQIC